MRRSLLLSAALLACLCACRAKIDASLSIDGKPFTPTSCKSGESHNFMGIDLIDDAGLTLRLVQSPANKPSIILMDGADVTELGECGKLRIQRQNSSANGIMNVEGEGKLECKTDAHSVSGSFTFEFCH